MSVEVYPSSWCIVSTLIISRNVQYKDVNTKILFCTQMSWHLNSGDSFAIDLCWHALSEGKEMVNMKLTRKELGHQKCYYYWADLFLCYLTGCHNLWYSSTATLTGCDIIRVRLDACDSLTQSWVSPCAITGQQHHNTAIRISLWVSTGIFSRRRDLGPLIRSMSFIQIIHNASYVKCAVPLPAHRDRSRFHLSICPNTSGIVQ